jgi:hypothetical protein
MRLDPVGMPAKPAVDQPCIQGAGVEAVWAEVCT